MNIIRFEPKEALKDFERIREIDPQYSLNYLNLGVTQANLKDYSGAANSIQKAIDWYRPGYFDGVFDSEVSEDVTLATNRNVIYADGKSFNAALYYELANVESFRGGDNFETLLKAADAHADKTNPSVDGYLVAMNWAWLQIRKEPDDYGSLAVQAYLWRRAGYRDWAKYYFIKFQCQHAEAKDPRYASLARWVDTQRRSLDDGGRVDCANIPMPRTLSDPRLKPLKADRLASIGRYREAVALLDPEIARDPNNIELLLLRARYAQRAGYYAGYWKEVEDQKRFYAIAREDFAKLLKLVETDTAYKPIVYVWWSFLGPEVATMDDNQRKFYYEKAIELGPANSGVMVGLSDMIADSQPEKALSLLKTSIALDPSGPNYYKLAALQNKTGKYGDALKSINLAIALPNPEATYYEERERVEAGLGVGEVERKRHLAEGYAAMGDDRFKQGQQSEAYQSYRKARQTLSDLAKSNNNGGAATDIGVINAKIARVIAGHREKTSARITKMTDGAGAVRQVTIDRGSDDGVVAADEGTLWSIYSGEGDKQRKVQQLGKAKVLSVDRDSAVVEITMDAPTGDKLARLGDMVELSARVPPLAPRSVLWNLAKFHINFTTRDGEQIFADYRKLYDAETPEMVDQILDEIATEVSRTAARVKESELMNRTIKEGRFKGKTLRQAMEKATRADVSQMMHDIWESPSMYYGHDAEVVLTFAVWALGEPK
jgi:tetratricopeptide (TPR) repeat protein